MSLLNSWKSTLGFLTIIVTITFLLSSRESGAGINHNHGYEESIPTVLKSLSGQVRP